MDSNASPVSSLSTTGDTGLLLQELMHLQNSKVFSTGSIGGTAGAESLHEVVGSGEGTNPTLAELMKTMFKDNPGCKQLITLQGTDTVNSFSVYGREVDVIASKSSSGIGAQTLQGSNKVKITPVVRYDWEQTYYVGNLVAIHKNTIHAAYILRGKSGGVVRIVNRRTAARELLKDFEGKVIDISFALTDDVTFGAIDARGNLFVYSIKDTENDKLQVTVLLNIYRGPSASPSDYHRVIWCPYIPDNCDDSSATESSSSDGSHLLLLTHDNKAEIWNVDILCHEGQKMLADDVTEGVIRMDSHKQAIMDAAFSPDGSAVATASLDGEVKFFMVNMEETQSPRCLHQWIPHEGQQLSCLFFLDDHKSLSSDAVFWKFAITGANKNQELKIWTCESWTCLQTIRFSYPTGLPSNFQVNACLKAQLDLSAKYLVLSDINRKVLYTLQIHQDQEANTAHVCSISEFLLAQPCLSFAILDASKKKGKKLLVEEGSNMDDITTEDLEKNENEEAEQQMITTSFVQIRLYTVHPKALQELQIRFHPESSAPPLPTPSLSTISHDDTGVCDGLSDMSISLDQSLGTEGGSLDLSARDKTPQPVLLAPDAFTVSPRKVLEKSPSIGQDQTRGSVGSSTSSFTQVTGINEEYLSPGSSVDQSNISNNSNNQTPTPKDYPTPKGSVGEVTPVSVSQPLVVPTNDSPRSTRTVDSSDEPIPHPEPVKSRLAAITVEDLFNSQESQAMGNKTFDSNSSTTGFEVNNDGVVAKQQSKESYDENDEEVAEVLGESIQDEEEGEEASVADIAQSLPAVEDQAPPQKEEVEDEEMEGTQPFENLRQTQFTDTSVESGLGGQGNQMLRGWPKPPEVDEEGQQRGEDSHQLRDSYEQEKIDEDNNPEEDNDQRVEGGEEEEEDDDDEDVRVEEEEEEIIAGDEEDEEEIDVRAKICESNEESRSYEEIPEEIEEQSEESELDGARVAPVAKAKTSSRRSPRIREIRREVVREVVDKELLEKLQEKMSAMMEALESQNAHIKELQYQIQEQQDQAAELSKQAQENEQLRQIAHHQPQPNIEEHLGKLESIVTSRVERMFHQHTQRENQRLQDLIKQTDVRDRQRHEVLHQQLTQSLTHSITSNVERNIKSEMHTNIVPNVKRILEPVKDQLHQELAQKLTATDSLLKDNINKMVRNKQTTDAIGMAAASALQTPMQVAYREAFQNVVVPSFERATHSMMQQINENFNKGTREYIKHLESNLEQVKQKHTEARDPIVEQLRQLVDGFQATAQNMQSQVSTAIQSQITIEMKTAIDSLQQNLIQSVRQAVKEEVSMAVREQGASISDHVLQAMRSGAVTPVSVTPDPHQAQTHISQLLRQGQLNAAFQAALSASNLDLVMFVCETVNPQQVFNQTPCPLLQPVLLSLIHQLSADLETSTELKHKYLEEAVMNLDLSNDVTRAHIEKVLHGLIQKLQLYIKAHPNAKTTRSLKMLQMASESLLR